MRKSNLVSGTHWKASPPLASDRVQRLDCGRVRLQLKRAFGNGTFAVEMDELSLVARLAAMVPPPWQNQVRIDRDQVEDYQVRKDITRTEVERWLAPNLNYDP